MLQECLAGDGELFDLALARPGRHPHRATQLAVDLQHQFDLVLLQRLQVDPRPGGVEQFFGRASETEVLPRRRRAAKTEVIPQRMGDVRRHRRQHPQQDAEAFEQRLPRAGIG